ncbi:tetratricopeptide repeat protein [Spirillospora sp. CA-294931]|uniref:tetratricopeptide repeat protein n=1 Tax=Spirillospora sp. CA-294931 TaxID=3240042 RepID=UPI003D8B501E
MASRAAARATVGPPRQLPAATDLVDRRAERQALDLVVQSAADKQVVVMVHGPSGVGKTALAVCWLRDVQDQYPDGELYADLRAEAGPAGSVAGVRARWLRALGVPPELVPDDQHEQAGLWRTITSRRRLAVLLDDITTAEQVIQLAPVTGLMIATCQSVPTALAAQRWTLPLRPLAEDDAVALLRRVLSRDLGHVPTTGTGDTPQLRVLARRCGYLPLALCAAAASGLPAAANPAASTDETLENVIASARERLPQSAARAYELLAAAPIRHFNLVTATAALDVDPPDAQAQLTALEQAHLLTATTDGRYKFASAEDARSAATALSAAEQDAVFARVRDRYLADAINASDAARPTSPSARTSGEAKPPTLTAREALEWLEREHLNIADLTRTAHRRGEYRTVLQLVRALWPACRLRIIPVDLWQELEALAQVAADRTAIRRDRAQVRYRRAICLIRARDFQAAATCLDQAEELWRHPPEPDRLAGIQRRRGHLHRAKGELDQAITYYQEALASYQRLTMSKDPQRERHCALTRLDLAAAHLDLDQPTTALLYALQAREHFAVADGQLVDHGRSHRYLGLVYTRLAQFGAAAEHLRAAHTLADQLGAAAELQAVTDACEELVRASGQPALVQTPTPQGEPGHRGG